jgi:hypothetical protein
MKSDALRSLGAAPSRQCSLLEIVEKSGRVPEIARDLLASARQETRTPGPMRIHLDLPLGEDVPAERRASGSSRVV